MGVSSWDKPIQVRLLHSRPHLPFPSTAPAELTHRRPHTRHTSPAHAQYRHIAVTGTIPVSCLSLSRLSAHSTFRQGESSLFLSDLFADVHFHVGAAVFPAHCCTRPPSIPGPAQPFNDIYYLFIIYYLCIIRHSELSMPGAVGAAARWQCATNRRAANNSAQCDPRGRFEPCPPHTDTRTQHTLIAHGLVGACVRA